LTGAASAARRRDPSRDDRQASVVDSHLSPPGRRADGRPIEIRHG